MSVHSPRVLVSGASGRLGQLLVPRLLARQARVRVLSRQRAVAQALWGGAVEIAEADFDAPAQLHQAVAGVDAVFLLSPISPRLAAQQQAVIAAAQAAGVPHLVKLSGSDWTVASPGQSLSGDAHTAVEAALQASGLSHVVLRPNAWMQVALGRIVAELRSGDVIRSAYADAAVSFIDARDIADVAVEALLNLRRVQQRQRSHPGPWVLTGPRAVDWEEIAAQASRGRAQAVRVEPAVPGAPDPYTAQVHGQFARLIRTGRASAVTDTVQAVLGRPARHVRDSLREQLG